jgi:hypothetical protein
MSDMQSTPSQAEAFDFSWDERQRNMLEAMGIRLWLPAAAPELRVSEENTARPLLKAERIPLQHPLLSRRLHLRDHSPWRQRCLPKRRPHARQRLNGPPWPH